MLKELNAKGRKMRLKINEEETKMMKLKKKFMKFEKKFMKNKNSIGGISF